MELKRLKSIDIFRGLCMAWMILNHLFDWWLKSEYNWLKSIMISILDPIGVTGFLFISGVSISLSYRKRIIKAEKSETYNFRIVRNSYLFRAFFILIIALIYNSAVAISLKDPSMVWTWFVLLTAAISLFLAWPLLKTPKFFRILIGLTILIAHLFIVSLLIPYEGDSNIYGLLFHILYNDIHQDPILIFFPFFLFGTVIGDMIFDTLLLNNNKKNIKNRFFAPSMIIGILLITIGVLYSFPDFLIRESLSWIIYSLGINVLFISILIYIEKYEIIETTKSYKFLFYYSYYSLTIYLAHNLLYFLFLHQLNVFNIWFFVIGAFFFIGLILRATYKIWEGSASIKVQISKLSLGITMRIEERINKKYRIKVNQ